MSKYKSKKIEIDGIRFDSKSEAQYYVDNKSIIELCQPSFVLQKWFEKNWKKYRPIHYIWDFLLKDWTVIDVKWLPTEWAKLKRKLFDYLYPNTTLRRVVKYKGERVDYDYNEKRKKSKK